MFDHISLKVTNYKRSLEFYKKALAPLGITVVQGGEVVAGFGVSKDDGQFWLGEGTPVVTGIHLAFAAKTRAQVDLFYQAAMEAGAKDNGAPGLRTKYHPNYYGAFVLDPDGNNVEAVCHTEK